MEGDSFDESVKFSLIGVEDVLDGTAVTSQTLHGHCCHLILVNVWGCMRVGWGCMGMGVGMYSCGGVILRFK